MTRNLIVAVFAVVVAGCGAGGKTDVNEDFTELASLDDKSDAFSYRMRVLGALSYGETSPSRRYQNPPRFRAYTFSGKAGDAVEVTVASPDGSGDAVAWITDNRFNVLAFNDDASASTFDAHLTATLPRASTYYVIYREYALDRANFTVSLTGPAAGCVYNGATYSEGDNFTAADYCNTCTCGPNGFVGCTKKFCIDCHTEGCDAGSYCTVCKTIDGPRYTCMPDGSVC
jgi:hypothetical protein